MNIIEIIDKKRLGKELTKEEIAFMVNGFLDSTIPDYQMSSFLMAIVLKGMSDEETLTLTDVMLKSGDVIDLSMIHGVKVDKHSTGGVGDKTTIILAPIVASLGVPVAKFSGRGLGHTGGTIDKLESIPGYQVALEKEDFVNQVNEIGCAVASLSTNLVPADKAIYALRDVTGTVASIPLIASSIMSKKIASGADKILIDVKVGSGALVQNIEEARELAKLMVKIGNYYKKETICILTNMNTPLGCNIGNALEVKECIEVLQNGGPKDLRDLVIYLATYMVHLGKNISTKDATKEVLNALEDGSAYEKFVEMVTYQGGDLTALSFAPKVFSIKSTKTGFIAGIDALKVGNLVHHMGAGRSKKEDVIHYGVGMEITAKIGDFITEGEELAKVYLDSIDVRMQDVLDCFSITEESVASDKIIYEVIS